jgi:hypothetical protein
VGDRAAPYSLVLRCAKLREDVRRLAQLRAGLVEELTKTEDPVADTFERRAETC